MGKIIILGHLKNSFRKLASEKGNILDLILDPAMVVDSALKINSCNEPAEKLLSNQGLFFIGGKDLFRINDTAAHEALTQLVRLTCSGLASLARLDDILIVTSNEAHLITAVPISFTLQPTINSTPFSFSENAAALLIVRPHVSDRATLISQHAGKTFKLTHAEIRLVLEFENGGTLHEIAQRLGVSRSTVHSQLKAIFQKTGTSKQRDMITLLLNATSTRKTFTVLDKSP
jgi:DNA-binding CsgD family transcriptional regulator